MRQATSFGMPGKTPRRLPDGKIILMRRKGGVPFRAEKKTHRVSPPGQGPRPHEGRPRKYCAGQRPPGRAGRWPGVLPPSGALHAQRGTGAMAPATPRRARAQDLPVFQPAAQTGGVFQQPVAGVRLAVNLSGPGLSA